MSKAAVRKNQADLLNQQKKDRKDLFAQRRQLASGTGSVNFGNLATNSGGGSGGGLLNVNIESSPNTNALIKTGDSMEGPLAFKPNNITISGGKLTMSTILLSNPTSWCIATGEGSAADDLNYIITQYNGADVGALFSGQILILQAGVYNITLKHRGTSSSNIYIPSGSDLTLTGYTSGTSTGGEIAILMYDDQVVGGEWILVATSKPLGSGGTGMQNPAVAQFDMATFSIEGNWDIGGGQTNFINVDPTVGIEADLDMNTFDIKDVCRLGFELGGSALPATISGISASTARLHYNVPTSDYHYFTVNNDGRLKIDSGFMEIQDGIDIRNPTTTVPGTAGSGSTEVEYGDIHGWLKIQVDGGNYSIPVWALP